MAALTAKASSGTKKLKGGSRRQPERTRAAILQAAMRAFATDGVAGARTDEIARAAGVNKALLYYYFKDKEALFGAVLDDQFSELTKAIEQALATGTTPRQKFMAYLCAHFDFVSASPLRPKLFHREMMSAGPHLNYIVEKYLRPTFMKIAAVVAEGAKSGEFRQVDPMHVLPSVIGTLVFYFATPVPGLITGKDPFAPEQVAQRRAAVIDFVSAALFRDAKAPAQAEVGRGTRPRGTRDGRPGQMALPKEHGSGR
jgi:TetR/AcrR family transcriptional regulator